MSHQSHRRQRPASTESEHADERQLTMAHETQPAQYLSQPSQPGDFAVPGSDRIGSATHQVQVTRVSAQSNNPGDAGQSPGSSPVDAQSQAGNSAAQRPSGGKLESAATAIAPLRVPEVNRGLQLNQRPAEVVRIAIEVFAMTSSWVDFYRAILGPDGVARKLFKGADQNRFWESTPEFFQIQEMLTAIRSQDDLKSDSIEPLRMITIRLPVSMHEALKLESKERGTSINKLCLSKLLNGIDQKLIPQEKGAIRGRKPGPQGKRAVVKSEI